MAATASDERLMDLSAELGRVADCAYTPSLQRLHDVLQKIDNPRLLLRWARGNGCQIDSLAAAILEGIELWPFALDILRILAYIPAFRDAVLRQKPVLLDTLIKKAIESDTDFNKYSATCVSLLSHPVDIAIPSSFPELLMQLVDKAVRSLSPETIRPIYQLLSAMGSGYLDILSFDVIARLQDRLVEVLTKLNMDERFGDLLCLGVLAKFASRPRTSSDVDKPNIPSSPVNGSSMTVADRYVSARKLFEDKRAPKTLDLAVIRAITACSESCTLNATDIAESLKLSGEIVEAFHCRERQAWAAKNGGKVKKLQRKILRTDIDAETQCEALNFLVKLSDGQSLPQELVPVFEKLLLTADNITLSARVVSQNMIQLDESGVHDILLKLLRLACDNNPPSHGLLTQLDSGLHLVHTFTAAIPTATSFREALLSCISGKHVERLLQRFTTQRPTSPDFIDGHEAFEICPRACAEALYQLHQDLTTMLLSTALYASGLETSVQCPSTLLLQKQVHLSNSCLPYGNCRSRRLFLGEASRASLFEARGTPRVDSISHDWRTEIVDELSREAGCRYESLVRMVGDICRDLELRCNEAERPLREEQSRSQDLRGHLEAAQRRVTELEGQARHREHELISLNNERTQLSDQTKTHKECLKGLEATLDNIRQELDQAKLDADIAVQTAIENARQRDLAYLATLAGKDQVFEEQSSKLAVSETQVKTLECEVIQLKAEVASRSETIQAQQTAIEELNNGIAAAKDLAAFQEARIGELQRSECDLISNRDDIVRKAQNESQVHDSAISELKQELQAAKAEAAGLQQQYDSHAEAKEAVILRLEESLRASNKKWQSELAEACNSAALADQRRASIISDLQNKNKRLRKEREERAKEFAEAQGLSARLMAVMGITKDHGTACKTSTTGSREERSVSPPCKLASPDLPASDVDLAPSSEFSNANRSGPTPKRTKRRRSLQFERNEGATTARASTRNTMRHRRTPLADIASRQSRGPVTPTRLLAPSHSCYSKETDGEVLQMTNRRLDSDDESFGGGDVFTSTDQQRLSVLGTKPYEDISDETTADY